MQKSTIDLIRASLMIAGTNAERAVARRTRVRKAAPGECTLHSRMMLFFLLVLLLVLLVLLLLLLLLLLLGLQDVTAVCACCGV